MFRRKKSPVTEAVPSPAKPHAHKEKLKSSQQEKHEYSLKPESERGRPHPVTDPTSSPGVSNSTPSSVKPQGTAELSFEPGGECGSWQTEEEEVFDKLEDSRATKYPDKVLAGRGRVDTAASLKIDCSYEL